MKKKTTPFGVEKQKTPLSGCYAMQRAVKKITTFISHS
jgi:hypothetical protein